MSCEYVRDRLLEGERLSPEAGAHVRSCPSCMTFAARARGLDETLQAALVLVPASDLQLQLLALARREARALGAVAAPMPDWWRGWAGVVQPWVVPLVASVTVALAGWRVLTWAANLGLILGDISTAFDLLISSPAAEILPSLQPDLQGIATWGLISILAWMAVDGPTATGERPGHGAAHGA